MVCLGSSCDNDNPLGILRQHLFHFMHFITIKGKILKTIAKDNIKTKPQ